MEDVKEYIESGILELYVAGTLNREDSYEVYANLQKYPELREHVKSIEHTVVKITELNRKKHLKAHPFANLKHAIQSKPTRVIPIKLYSYMGWAASIALTVGIISLYTNNNNLKENLTKQIASNELLDEQRAQLQGEVISKNMEVLTRDHIIAFISLEKTQKVNLAGQAAAPKSYAHAYWNTENNEMYLDLTGLPPAPEGKVYQLWSLTLSPLTPTSLGTLDAYNQGERFIKVSNKNKSEAFGITLEPKGGSESPTLKQLYTLGTTKIS